MALHAATIASSNAGRGTAPGPNVRLARRSCSACSGEARNRSSSAGRTRSSADPSSPPRRSTPRTIAAGMRASFAITSPLAAATSSASATSVASSSRPRSSARPRRSTTAGRPSHPIATFTTPVRHARPKVSVTTTARSRTSSRADSRARSLAALASGSSGSRASDPASTFEASTPAFAQTKPCAVSAITRSPRRATTRTVSAETASVRSTPRTMRPSAFETIFEVTTITSPSSTPALRRGAPSTDARSSPGRTSGTPSTGSTVTGGRDGDVTVRRPARPTPGAPRRRRLASRCR